MLKKFKNWMAIVILAVATCLNCGVASANSTVEMEEDEFFYECDSITWSNSGSKVTVEGTFYNLSSDCDVVALEDIVFGLYDGNDDLLFTVDADTSFIEVIPHESSYTYTFWVDDINDIPQKSKKNNSVYIEDGSYSYNACEGRNCSYCALADEDNSNSRKSTNKNTSNSGNSGNDNDNYDEETLCSRCDGLGVCMECFGDGDFDCDSYCIGGSCTYCSDNGKILVDFDSKGNPKYRNCPYCYNGSCKKCHGTGRIDCRYCTDGKCPSCHGAGYI